MKIRDLTLKDYPIILKLNNENTPAVSELSIERLKSIHEMSSKAWVTEDTSSGMLSGFCLILPEQTDYTSQNYKWVTQHYEQFEYLDRIVISEKFRGQGCGRLIYEQWFKESPSKDLLLEVNIRPRNEGSILFHQKMGFITVGEQETSGGEKRVQYMLRKS